MSISRPTADEYAPHYETYISKVQTDDLIGALENGRSELISFIRSIPAEKLEYRYQEGKWTIKEIIIHLMDAERIFTYRVLRFSRNDRTALSGFDENEYVPESNASARSLQSLIDEYSALRQSTIELFRNITDEMSLRTGIANGKEISVRALGYVIPGHEIHHAGVIKERYL
jgi:uncharacterized damage-inducible protein DinB